MSVSIIPQKSASRVKRSGYLRLDERDGLYHGWHRGLEFTVPPAVVMAEYRVTFGRVMQGALEGLNKCGAIDGDEFARREALRKGSYVSRIGQDGIRWCNTAPWLNTTGEWAIA